MELADHRQRLLEVARERAVSLSQLSRLIGRNGTYLQQFVQKGSPRRLAGADRAVLAQFLGIAETELGQGEPDKADRVSAGQAARQRGADWIDVPRLALGASAGPGALPTGEEAIGAFRFSARWLRELGLDPAALSAIAVRGDSMEPTLRDGDEILVDRTPRPPRDGIHVVRVDDALLVKRLETGRAGAITLISDNRAYPPQVLPIAQVEVIGRVVWKSGRL